MNKITQLKKAGSSAKGGSEFVIETIDSLIAKLNQLKTKVNLSFSQTITFTVQKDARGRRLPHRCDAEKAQSPEEGR